MPVLKALHLTNIVSYDQVTFPLDLNGITYVYGRNLDSSPDTLKSNGAGKSVPFTMLAELLTDQSPLIDARDAAKDGFSRKGAQVSLEFEDYRLSKRLEGRSLKLDLEKLIGDVWKPTKVRTNEYVWSKLAQLLPMSDDEFYALYYIDSSRPSLLQRGSHGARLKLFSQMFNLESYDKMLAEVKARIKELRLVDARLQEVNNQVAVLESAVDEELEAEGDKLTELRQRQRNLSEKRQQASALLSLASLWNSHQPALQSIQVFLKNYEDQGYAHDLDLFRQADLKELLSAVTDGRKAIRARLRLVNQSASGQVQRKVLRTQITSAKDRLGDWLKAKNPTGALQEALTAAEWFQDSLAEMTAQLKQLDKRIEEIDVAAEPVKARRYIDAELDEAPTDPAELRKAVHTWVSDARAKQELATRASKKFDQVFKGGCDGECPTCRQDLDEETISLIQGRLNKAVEKADADLAMAEKMDKACDRWCTWREATIERAGLEEQREKLHCEYNLFYAEGSNSLSYEHPATPQNLLKVFADYQRDKKALAELGDTEESDDDPDELTDRLTHYEKACQCIESLIPVVKQLANARDQDAGEYDVAQLEAGLAAADKKLRALMEEIPRMSQRVSVNQNNLRQLTELELKRSELEKQLVDLPSLKALEVAYGQKGLKQLAIQRASQLIESNLNLNGHLLFSEPAVFTMDVTDTKMNILITRKNKKGQESTVDVRRLSGAESRQFNLLMPRAILPLIPAGRRLNLMVLDEPTANMDPPAIDMITTKFLPHLKELVPHIIVISPNELPVDDPDIRQWLVTRQDGVTTLDTGEVDE